MKGLIFVTLCCGCITQTIRTQALRVLPTNSDRSTSPAREALIEEAQAYCKLGGKWMINDPRRASNYAVRARALLRNALGQDVQSDKLYEDVLNLLSFCNSFIDERMAEEADLELLAVQRTIYGESHERYTGSLRNLGYVYIRSQRFARAEHYLRESVRILKQVAPDSEEYADSLVALATVLLKTHDAEAALRAMLEAAGIILQKRKHHFPQVLAHTRLAGVYTELKDYPKALDHLHVAEKIDNKDSPDAGMLWQLGIVYLRQKEYARAESQLKKVLAIAEKWENNGGERYAEFVLPFCQYYVENERFAEAEELLDRAIGALENHWGLDHVSLVEPLVLLAKCRRHAGDERDEARWMEKRSKDIQAAWEKQEAEDKAALAKERGPN